MTLCAPWLIYIIRSPAEFITGNFHQEDNGLSYDSVSSFERRKDNLK